MIYQFRCDANHDFSVDAPPFTPPSRPLCDCGAEGRRVYTPPQVIVGKPLSTDITPALMDRFPTYRRAEDKAKKLEEHFNVTQEKTFRRRQEKKVAKYNFGAKIFERMGHEKGWEQWRSAAEQLKSQEPQLTEYRIEKVT